MTFDLKRLRDFARNDRFPRLGRRSGSAAKGAVVPGLFRTWLVASLALAAGPTLAEDLPTAIQCYQTSANAQDIDAYMACFTEDAEMIDVRRVFTGQDAIRAWAEREVMSGGGTFRHRDILEQSEGFAKTEVTWLSWIVHYSYWWDVDGKITKMSLQYAD